MKVRKIKPDDDVSQALRKRMARLEDEYEAIAKARAPERDTGGATYIGTLARNMGHALIPDDDGGPAFCNGIKAMEDKQ